MKPAKRLNGIGEYYFSQKLREIEELKKLGKNIINLGIGSPDQPPHPDVIRVLQEESAKPGNHAYQSYKGSPVFREAISKWYLDWYNVVLNPATEILPLIGSKEGILHICMTYLNKGDSALVPDPGYPTYRSAVELAGADCLSYRLSAKNNYEPDLDKLESKNLDNVKLFFVNYPHMPTGSVADLQLLEKIVAFGKKHDIIIVHDNPYSFILNDKPMSLLSVKGGKEQVIELNSLSKSHNMAGWRVGMLCSTEQRINEVLRFKSNMDSGMFLPVQLAAAKALSLGGDWYKKVNDTYHARREKIFALLDKLQCSYEKRQSGLFVWARIPGNYKNSYELSDAILYKSDIFITPGGIFGKAGKNHVRVSLCAPQEKIEEAINRL